MVDVSFSSQKGVNGGPTSPSHDLLEGKGASSLHVLVVNVWSDEAPFPWRGLWEGGVGSPIGEFVGLFVDVICGVYTVLSRGLSVTRKKGPKKLRRDWVLSGESWALLLICPPPVDH